MAVPVIGFAVPVDTVRKVVPQLIRYGREVRPSLGIAYIDDQIARRFGVRGVIVQSVRPGSGADDAGLTGMWRNAAGRIALGDVIVGVGQSEVADSDDLLTALEQYQPGDQADIHTIRDGESRSFVVRLSESR